MSANPPIHAADFTAQQHEAIVSRGNLLVAAGAGTGKTRTLVMRCLRLVVEERVSLDNILMVTFTEAAAAEMRARIRKELRELQLAQPKDEWLAQQLALLDTARICTLHSFCLQLGREHFHALGLDPQFYVLDEQQTRPMMRLTLDALLERHYSGKKEADRAMQSLVRVIGRGDDARIRRLVLKLHNYSQSLPDPDRWLEEQQRRFAQADPVEWRQWLLTAVSDWRDEWREMVAGYAAEAPAAKLCSKALEHLPAKPSIAAASAALHAVQEANTDANWPRGTKGKVRDPLEKFFADADFLGSLLPGGSGKDPLAEDWGWTRPHMASLVSLTREFTTDFTRAKRELGGVDFADLEQCALKLLRDPAVAAEWRSRLAQVFVDEYQDINEVQDKIIESLSRDGAEANRFMVGDVKQSIYRFRLANPKIFSGHGARWAVPDSDGKRIPLTENFRSRSALLDFVNPLFACLMRAGVGGVDYEPLQFGAPEDRAKLAAKPGDAPRVELHLVSRGGNEGNGEEPEEEADRTKQLPDLLAVEREARLLARRLRELKESGHEVWDEQEQAFRPVRWSDMAVLMRSPSGRAEAFAIEFSRAGVPLSAARDGFFESTEVSDLLSLLKLLDNPLQDVPLVAVLRSPLAGLSLDELAEIRAQNTKEHFWTALMSFQRVGQTFLSAGSPDFPVGCSDGGQESPPNRQTGMSALRKTNQFLRQFSKWRGLVRQGSLSQCLETALAETHYEAMLLAGPRGEERVANVRRLLDLARQFDPYQRQGLYRFLRFVELQEDEELDLQPAAASAADAVRLMSIHKSKGLEFPVVALACLGTQFNEQDLNEAVLVNEVYGLCPRITPPDVEQSYPGLTHWMARRNERRELRGEEMRLLYVALTRARDSLILVGTAPQRNGTAKWESQPDDSIDTREVVGARSHLDWLLLWLPRATTSESWIDESTGRNGVVRWRIYDGTDPAFADHTPGTPEVSREGTKGEPGDAEALANLEARVAWEYPFKPATTETAKTSVSILRRRLSAESEEEARTLFRFQPSRRVGRRSGGLSAAQVGSAHHLFLQFASLAKLGDAANFRSEAERLRDGGWLTAEEVASLDLEALSAFWQSATGKRILAQGPENVHREIPFTARFSPADLAACGLAAKVVGDEFVVVQGMLDLAVILPKEIWLVDFKTDAIRDGALEEKARQYEPQVKLYALALSRIYRRPVTQCELYFLSAKTALAVKM